ncbi:MAG: hypothetical protein QOF18_2787, partial [Frankiaceae bacterium]|nr:hypothetical protein [Frankiaceae bacterium]
MDDTGSSALAGRDSQRSLDASFLGSGLAWPM